MASQEHQKLVLMGPPGAGKGTQGARLSDEFGIPKISTGDMLRDARREGTELGKRAAQYMNTGELVPDEVVIGIVRERLTSDDVEDGFILDGFPRTVEQAEALDEGGVDLDAVIDISVDENEVVRRLGGRLNCPKCGEVYHEEFDPPSEDNICDECGADLIKREDDQPEAIRQRLDSYQNKITPLKDFYRKRGLLVPVDGNAAPDKVENRIKKKLTD